MIATTAARRVLPCFTTVVALLVASLSTVAAGQPSATDSRPPTSLEAALAGYACGPQAAAINAAHFDCLATGVAALRADFGYNLTRLTPAQRGQIDRTCGPRRAAEGHDAYLACVSGRLTALRGRKAETLPAPAAAAAPETAATSRDDDAAPAPAFASVGSSSRRSSSTWLLSLIAAVGVAVAVAGGVLVSKRRKAARHTCRTCGRVVPPTADLCPDCRRQAADAVRHAASERAQRDRPPANNGRPPAPVQEPQRTREQADAEMRREHEELRAPAREAAEARAPEPAPAETVVGAKPDPDPTLAGDAFDPYTILGISRDADPDAITVAYRQALSKYDLNAVDFLGDDVRSYYRTKADAVERAYRELTSRLASSPETAVPRI